jgi:uncharacterized PurR-regulated membrane protein YhhQ (DUF165 family)
MELAKYLIGITSVFFVLVVCLSYFEQNNDPDSSINKVFASVGSIALGALFVYLISTTIDTGTIRILGAEIEKGLVIYLGILFLMGFLL